MIIDPGMLNERQYSELLRSGHARLHFSQLGEDTVLWHILKGQRDGFYVDVGCHHPLRFSNTAILSKFYGWRGLNIDGDASLIEQFNVHRPRDINICSCIGPERATRQFNVFHEAAVNTLDEDTANAMVGIFELKERRQVEVYPLAEVLSKYLRHGTTIDLLSIDVEGLDLAVLQSNDWDRFRPRVIAVEAHDMILSNAADHPMQRYLSSKGFKLTSHRVVTSIYESEN